MITIRFLTETDVDRFQALRLRGLRESPDAFAITEQEFEQEALEAGLWARRLRPEGQPPERFVLGAFDASGQLVGIVGLVREERLKMRHRAFVWGMYVAPEARGQGLGKALLQDLLGCAKALAGLEQLHLGVEATNVAARQLYLRIGFRVYGLEPHAFKDADRYLDEELMVLTLAEAEVTA